LESAPHIQTRMSTPTTSPTRQSALHTHHVEGFQFTAAGARMSSSQGRIAVALLRWVQSVNALCTSGVVSNAKGIDGQPGVARLCFACRAPSLTWVTLGPWPSSLTSPTPTPSPPPPPSSHRRSFLRFGQELKRRNSTLYVIPPPDASRWGQGRTVPTLNLRMLAERLFPGLATPLPSDELTAEAYLSAFRCVYVPA
jgi:hypothetical protein